MVITSLQNNLVKQIMKLKKDKSFIFLDNPKLINEAYYDNISLEQLISNALSLVNR